MKETRTEYLSRLCAEYPGAYHRIDDLMRQWDHENGYLPGAADVQAFVGAVSGPTPTTLSVDLSDPKPNNAAPEGGDAAPSNAPPKDVEQP